MKVQQSNQLINPFGGIQFVIKHIKEAGIDKFIDEQLGSRGEAARTMAVAATVIDVLHSSAITVCTTISMITKISRAATFYPA